MDLRFGQKHLQMLIFLIPKHILTNLMVHFYHKE